MLDNTILAIEILIVCEAQLTRPCMQLPFILALLAHHLGMLGRTILPMETLAVWWSPTDPGTPAIAIDLGIAGTPFGRVWPHHSCNGNHGF